MVRGHRPHHRSRERSHRDRHSKAEQYGGRKKRSPVVPTFDSGPREQRETERGYHWPDSQRAHNNWMPRPKGRPFQQPEDDSAESEDSEQRSDPIDATCPRRILALIHVAKRQHDHDGRERHVEKKSRPPAHVLDQPATD